MTDEVEFYVQIHRRADRNGYYNYHASDFRITEPDDPSGHLVRVTLRIDPAVFSSEVEAQVGLDLEGFREVVKDLKDI